MAWPVSVVVSVSPVLFFWVCATFCSPVIQRSHPSLYKRRKCPGSWRSGEEEKGGIGSVDGQAGPGACIPIVSAFQGSF